MQGKPLPTLIRRKKTEPEDDLQEATNDNILEAFSKFKKNPPVFDENGEMMISKEEGVE
jgi:hypothetical protein